MATVKEIYMYLDQIAPFALQMGFDNAGFLVGRGTATVERLLVALDITESVVEEATLLECQLIVSHHPVIFHPAKSITDETVTGRVLLALTEHKIAAICAHTNLDAAQGGVNCCLAQALELEQIGQLHQDGVDPSGQPYGIGRVGKAGRPGLSAAEYAAYVKGTLGAASVRYVDGGRPVERVAVGGGSCGSMLADAVAAGCDTFVTADVKYDQYLEAGALGINLMDAGHYPTEHVVCGPLAARLAAQFPDLRISISSRHKEIYGGV
ncbi:MAG: Nif3-like dinuclear metal center hexameric protein [Lawsonibacter sp.]|nr:Nif3-like dinuclear metal center hexameric protein [Lawsonibacter sp.]